MTMFKLLQAVRPNPLYTPGGVDNFWKVEGDDDERKSTNTEKFAVPRNEKEGDLPIDRRKEEGMRGMKGLDKRRGEGEKGENAVGWWAAAWKDDTVAWKNDTAGWRNDTAGWRNEQQ